jgi:hypothetical protein
MAEEKSKEPPREKKGKPVVKKVWGRVTATEDPNAKKPGPPAYEHG